MERTWTSRPPRAAWCLLLLATLVPAAGCTSALAAGMYLLKGYETPAEFKDLKGKKVVVVCRPPADDQYRNVRVPDRLAATLGKLLSERIKKVEIIDHGKVERWTDENDWVEHEEVGEALKADMVVAIDLEAFSIYQGTTLYQGQSSCSVRVLDMTNKGAVVYEKHLPAHLYPPNTGIPTSEREEEQFRREYINVLADSIGQLFYPHDALDDMSRDSDAVLR